MQDKKKDRKNNLLFFIGFPITIELSSTTSFESGTPTWIEFGPKLNEFLTTKAIFWSFLLVNKVFLTVVVLGLGVLLLNLLNFLILGGGFSSLIFNSYGLSRVAYFIALDNWLIFG